MSTVVLYIAGTGRSGSTVLANILGEVDGVFAAGEVRFLWQRGLEEGRLCGCGLPVRECPVWGRVLAEAGQLDDRRRVDAIVSMLQHTGRIRNLPAILAGKVAPRLDPARSPATAPERVALSELYAAIAAVTESKVIVELLEAPRVRQCSRRDPRHRPSGRAPDQGSRVARRTRGRARRRSATALHGHTWNRSGLPRAPCSGTCGTWQAEPSFTAARTVTSGFGMRTLSRIHPRPFEGFSRWWAWKMRNSPL